MPDTSREPAGAVATAEPPKPPKTPPRTATAAPGPGRKRGRGCLIAGVVVVIIVLFGLGALLWWALLAPKPQSGLNTPATASAFASAMKKAGVSAPAAPSAPVGLTGVKPVGSHPFSATFTYAELTALMQAFGYVPTSGTPLNLQVRSITAGTNSAVRLAGAVNSGGTSYTGWIEGPVRFSAGTIQSAGAFSANASGLGVSGAQAEQAANMLLGYLNAYLASAPGLKIDSATTTARGVDASGTAPNSISW